MAGALAAPVYWTLRSTGLKALKHRHIVVRKGELGGSWVWMPLPESKRHDKRMKSMLRAAIFYRLLRVRADGDDRPSAH